MVEELASQPLLRSLHTELACARSLLDELQSLLDAEHDVPSDLVLQVADELAAVARAMRRAAAQHLPDDFGPNRFDALPPNDTVRSTPSG